MIKTFKLFFNFHQNSAREKFELKFSTKKWNFTDQLQPKKIQKLFQTYLMHENFISFILL